MTTHLITAFFKSHFDAKLAGRCNKDTQKAGTGRVWCNKYNASIFHDPFLYLGLTLRRGMGQRMSGWSPKFL